MPQPLSSTLVLVKLCGGDKNGAQILDIIGNEKEVEQSQFGG